MHVTIKSPIPPKPKNVSGSAPNFSPSRLISAKPLVINAALALSPKPMPEITPLATAIIF